VALAAGTLLVQVLAAAAYWTVLGFLIILVYRQPFADAIVFANLLLPAMVFQGGTIIADGYMRGQGQSGVGVTARLAGALSMLVAAFAFYAPYRALAVPLAASVGSGVAALWLFAAMIGQSLAQQRSSAAAADNL
jgi:dolichol kinase